MSHTRIDTGVSKNIGFYSDAVVVEPNLRWFYSAGTPGIRPDGTMPADIEGQTRVMFENVQAALAKAGMDFNDIVKINTSVIHRDDVAGYVKIRKEILGDIKPAFMLSVIDMLVRPDILVEVEVVAAKA